ncbi:MAG: glutathione S-transferase family protein, partial [Exilibacterium sp.]
ERRYKVKLVIGNKNYSTWSLRPWLLLSAFDIDFEEIQESLISEGLKERLKKYSPTCRVPVLIDGTKRIWDSLAICEYVSEKYLNGRGWPENLELRAEARMVTCEMHSGFVALRNELPMNCRAIRKVEISPAAEDDISRIDSIWSECTQKYSYIGPWLFGEFSIADCFFAPVALRFATYGVPLSNYANQYSKLLRNHKCMINWVESAKAETEIVVEDEAGI